MKPGTHIGFVEQGNNELVEENTLKGIGIVDPFLVGTVQEGERFWMFLYPEFTKNHLKATRMNEKEAFLTK